MNNENTTNSSKGEFAPEPRVYELGYLIMPSVDEGDLLSQRDALVALITRFNGTAIDEGQPVLIDLAYEMDKLINNKKHTYSQAYFGWIKFEVSPDEIEELTKETEAVDTVLRSILTKTVRDNTLTSEQPFKVAKNSRVEDEDDDSIAEHDEEVTEEPSVDSTDDLTKIEGIGPKIASLLNDAGIMTFANLAATDASKVKEILAAAGSRFTMHDPTTWGDQAQLAAEGKWEQLQKWQDILDGGKVV